MESSPGRDLNDATHSGFLNLDGILAPCRIRDVGLGGTSTLE
jgi:hypothetical protein